MAKGGDHAVRYQFLYQLKVAVKFGGDDPKVPVLAFMQVDGGGEEAGIAVAGERVRYLLQCLVPAIQGIRSARALMRTPRGLQGGLEDRQLGCGD